jgi:CelD/BcsL family acetyltransferase involved in cellulose biosynthesis
MSARAPDIELSLHRDLASIEDEWRAFEQRAHCTVFQTYAWLRTWQQHVGASTGANPAVVIGRAAGDLVFLLPFAVDRWCSLRRLIWLGSNNNDYNGPLLAPEFQWAIGPEAFLTLWPKVLACIEQAPELRFDLIHLVHMPEWIGGVAHPMRKLHVTPHTISAHHAHLTGDWEAFYAERRSADTRRRDRTKRRRLQELGEVKLRIPERADEIARSFDALVSQKARSFARMGVPDIFKRPGHTGFYRSLALEPANRDVVHISRLDVGDTVAAVNLGLRFRGRYYHILASYTTGALSRYGPGAAHLHELMRHAIESRCKVFDFTVGDESYKRDWADTQVKLFEFIAAAGWRGAAAAWALQGSSRAKRLIKEAPRLSNSLAAARTMIGQLRPARRTLRPAPKGGRAARDA